MKHAKVSRANPALVTCAIDCSGSMDGSHAHRHAFAAINALRKHARAKRQQVRLVVIGFSGGAKTEYNGWCENFPGIKRMGGTSQTHLKEACDQVGVEYDNHVKNHCNDGNPLVNVLMFTDGSHSPGLDNKYADSGISLGNNKWGEKTPDGWIKRIADLENVLLGVIDYSGKLPQFPLPTLKIPYKKVTCASVLEKSMLQRAYARDLTVPPPPGQSLEDVFGPIQNLVGRRFIVSSKAIKKNPQVTSAFVRLGTASTFAGANTNTGGNIGGAGPPMPPDDTDFTSRLESSWGEGE